MNLAEFLQKIKAQIDPVGNAVNGGRPGAGYVASPTDVMNASAVPGENRGVANIVSNFARNRAIGRLTSAEDARGQEDRVAKLAGTNASTANTAQITQRSKDITPSEIDENTANAEYLRAHAKAVTDPSLIRPGIERISGQMISVADAQNLGKAGQKFLNREGKEIDVASLPPHMGLSVISGGSPGQPRYEVVTQPTVDFTADNVRSRVPRLTPEIPLVQGVANPPSQTIREEQGVNAQGNPETVPLQSETRRVGKQPTVPSVGEIPKNTTPGYQMNITPPPAQGQPGGPPAQRQGPLGAIGEPRALNALPGAQAQQQATKATSLKAAAVQVFGDPQNPDFRSMESFAHLADDPESRRRVGTAVNLIVNTLAQAPDGGERFGATVLGSGGELSGGGFFSRFKNSYGFTNAAAEAQAKVVDRATQALTPEEDLFVSRILAAVGSVSGIRTITQGGAYKWSIDAIGRELPIPGLTNVQSSGAFKNKLASLAEELQTAAQSGTIGDAYIDKNYFRGIAQRLHQPVPESTTPEGAPGPGAGTVDIMTDESPVAGTMDWFRSKLPGSVQKYLPGKQRIAVTGEDVPNTPPTASQQLRGMIDKQQPPQTVVIGGKTYTVRPKAR